MAGIDQFSRVVPHTRGSTSQPNGTASAIATAFESYHRGLDFVERPWESSPEPVDVITAPDVIRHGVFVVGRGGRVIDLNPSAERLAAINDGLRLRDNVLQASSVAIDDELRAGIAAAISDGRDHVRRGGHLAITRPSGKRPYVARLVPLCTNDRPEGATVAIIVIDPAQEFKPPESLLRKLFGLTRAETEVALHMLGGDGLQAIADELSVSLATVKTHVQHVYRKTDTHRQVELVRLLMAITP